MRNNHTVRIAGATRLGLAGFVAGAIALSTATAGAQFEMPIPLPGVGGIGDRPIPQLTLTCPDPAARIRAEVIAPSVGGSTGRVRIHATVHNNGADYVSRPGQQVAQLYQGSAAVTSRDFPSLGSGGAAPLTLDVNWTPGGEFNSDFVLLLTYGPDIFIDNMATNDDCRMTNNEARLTAASIDALFSG